MTDDRGLSHATGIIIPVDVARLRAVGEAANRHATANVFTNYLERRSANTVRRQHADLAAFASYLADVGIVRSPDDLQHSASAWVGVSWGVVSAFVRWQLRKGFAVSSVNVRLSTIRVYAGLAFQAGALSAEAHALIRAVKSYSAREAQRIDSARPRVRKPEAKKAQPVSITEAQAARLKAQPTDTPQGRRDGLLMALLLDHGLRVSEVALLTVGTGATGRGATVAPEDALDGVGGVGLGATFAPTARASQDALEGVGGVSGEGENRGTELPLLQGGNIDLERGVMTFYRPKVDLTQTHKLSGDTLAALKRCQEAGDIVPGPLLRGSRKSGELTDGGMSARAITKRVKVLGEAIGIQGLSPHDLRHHWATHWAERVDRLPRGVFTLQEAGGWKSVATVRRYVEAATIANEGMV